MLTGKVHNEIAPGHKSFLIRQGDGFAGLYGRHRRTHTAEPHHRGENDVYIVSLHQRLYRAHTAESLYIGTGKGGGECRIFGFAEDNGGVGIELYG